MEGQVAPEPLVTPVEMDVLDPLDQAEPRELQELQELTDDQVNDLQFIL